MGELLDIKVKSRSNKQLKLQAPSEIEAVTTDLTNKKNSGPECSTWNTTRPSQNK